jgi:molybdopterin/thiamine biosynthesis adenylyltransferase
LSARADVLLVGAGGIGAPAALALGAAGLSSIEIVDDDRVELGNLHRQILFAPDDVGAPKLEATKRALAARFPRLDVRITPGRALPATALGLVKRARVVLDATDNFASRFLLADACRLAGVPVVHAAAVRWRATVFAASAAGRPCYRCLFEDIPAGPAPDCATAGVMGPVCGVAGAVAADRALAVLAGDPSAFGHVISFDGLGDKLRRAPVRPRAGCPLCGERPAIDAIEASRYVPANDCSADAP